MRITFGKNDPRAGMTADVPADVAQAHIDSGAAREDKATPAASETTNSTIAAAPEVREPARAATAAEAAATTAKTPARKTPSAKKAR